MSTEYIEKGERGSTEISQVKEIEVGSNLDAHKMHVWHSVEARFAQSREIRDQVKRSVQLKIKAQHELLEQKIGTQLDIEKKVIFDQYLSSVAQLEDQFIRKMDSLDQQNDAYEQDVRDKYYEFFDKAREGLKKWEGNPERYRTEIERLNKQEQKRLQAVSKRIEQVESKREAILDKTLEVFDSEYGFESLKQKLDIF